MKTIIEIEKYSEESDKPILRWLFSRYHWSSEWSFVVNVIHVGVYPKTHRVWVPKLEGVVLYNNRELFNQG